MILLLDTSTPTCRLTIASADGKLHQAEWQADRKLALGLHEFVRSELASVGAEWHDLTGLGVYRGPGSYTGLRIGLTVMNTLASSLGVPILGGEGNDWKDQVLTGLADGANDKIVLPEYGGTANITRPRK